jgi:hypothetical protein
MILHLNHIRRDAAAATTSEVVAALLSLLEEGDLEAPEFARLRIHLDWIQYRHNFREPVMVMQGEEEGGESLSPMEVRIDARQVTPGSLRDQVRRVMAGVNPHRDILVDRQQSDGRVYLEEFRTFRSSVAWEFNRLYWHRLKDWERATGRGYEEALPGGKSDANHPAALADSVADFWTLLRDMESQNQLPPELFVLEIGVGMGTRAGLWLDRFRALDQERGTKYYPQLRFLLGDYSLATLDRSKPAVQKNLDVCSFIVLDAIDPIKTLSFLRHKVLHIHMTNVYDNLPDEELVRRDGRLYWVQVRAYLPAAEAKRIAEECQINQSEVAKNVTRLLEVGPECMADRERGVRFWQMVWEAVRLEERLVDVEKLPDASFPAGIDYGQIEEMLRDAPSDLRFHLNSGALESFRNTLPLLHPRGYLQVQDIFVTGLSDYRMGFYGPGKLDGSIVNWVNGVLLREVAERAGYDVHFAPFHYRPGSKTSVLYTTRRE